MMNSIERFSSNPHTCIKILETSQLGSIHPTQTKLPLNKRKVSLKLLGSRDDMRVGTIDGATLGPLEGTNHGDVIITTVFVINIVVIIAIIIVLLSCCKKTKAMTTYWHQKATNKVLSSFFMLRLNLTIAMTKKFLLPSMNAT
jgi:hypothetical protein